MSYKQTTPPKTEANRPTYIAYHVQEPAEQGGKARWVELGCYFAHRDIVLSANIFLPEISLLREVSFPVSVLFREPASLPFHPARRRLTWLLGIRNISYL